MALDLLVNTHVLLLFVLFSRPFFSSTMQPQEVKKCQTYVLEVEPNQDDEAKETRLCNFCRDPSRWSFFAAFFILFSLAPLLSEIKKTLYLTKQQVWTSFIFASLGFKGTIWMRFVPCEKNRARILFTIILCVASIPIASTAFVNSAEGLARCCLVIGIAGGTMYHYWTSPMVTNVGTANALVGGLGNVGAGVAQLVMGSLLFPLFKMVYDDNAERAWRTVSIVPAVVTFATSFAVYFSRDDAPKGDYNEMRRNGTMPEVSAAASFSRAFCNFNTWILFVQYACCFGVELTMNNAAALYFKEVFEQTTESAAAIASIFGWMNLFSRGLGGFASDWCNARLGMRGRILVHTIFLVCEGCLVLVFMHAYTLGTAIVVMVLLSVLVQAAEGSSYGIVPYIDPTSTGWIAAIVGAGGFTGAIGFALGFREFDYLDTFITMGYTILGSSILSVCIHIKGSSALFFGSDEIAGEDTTLSVPELGDKEDEA